MSPSFASAATVLNPPGDALMEAGAISGSGAVVVPHTSNSANVRKFTPGTACETRSMRTKSACTPRNAEVPQARELLLSVAFDGRKT